MATYVGSLDINGEMKNAMSSFGYDFDRVEAAARKTRKDHRELWQARPVVRLWYNDPSGQMGLLLKGQVKAPTSAKFPFTKNKAASGTLQIPMVDPLAKWIVGIPDDPDAKKNVVVSVDHMGGRLRWSGLLHHWTVMKSDGIYMLDITFIDDLQYLDFLLGPPNPALPIPIFQFPRVLPIFGPAGWSISLMILINLMRVNGNWWQLPDDPFSAQSWWDNIDFTRWQVHIKSRGFFEDQSMWTVLATRMNKISSVIEDALEDTQQVMRYRRIFTVDGESPADMDMWWLPHCLNGCLVFEVVDESGFYNSEGTATGGWVFGGFLRTIVQFLDGFVEDTRVVIGDDETIYPEEYYQPDWLKNVPILNSLTIPTHPWVVARDSPWSQIETGQVTYSPATAVSVVVGGDNPYADQMAELMITAVGDILGYFLLGGFSSAGDIAATVIMPFIEGTILAWLQWKNTSRANNLGWAHLWEVYQQGAEANAWSLSAVVALRAGFLSTKSETTHQFVLSSAGPIYPGLHFNLGQRIGSTCEHVWNKMFVSQVESIELAWGVDSPHEAKITVGQNKAAMSTSERMAKLLSKALDTINQIGVRLLS